MNEYVFLATAIIGGFFSLAAIELMNRNWFKREKAKYSYQVKRAKMKQKGLQVKKSTPDTPTDWLAALKNLDPEMLHTLIDTFSGEGGEIDEEGGLEGILSNIVQSRPDLVQNLLSNLGGSKKGEGSENKYI